MFNKKNNTIMNKEILILTWFDEKVGHKQELFFTSKIELLKFYKANNINNHLHKITQTSFWS